MKYTNSTYEELVEQINALQDNVNNLEKNAVSQKQTEYDLVTSERNLSAILEKNADGIIIVDTAGIVLYVNPAAERLFDRSKEKFIGYSFGFPVSASKTEDRLVIIKKDTFCEVEFRVVSVNWGKRLAFQLSVRDITVRKQTEKALRESETRHKTLVQTIPDLIWLKDKEGVYLSCNSMFGRFFGATEKDIAGKTDYDFVGRELADFFRENDQRAMDSGKPSVNEEWITFADDGHKACVETIKAPTYNSEGILTGVLGIARDITLRKSVDESLKKSENQFKTLTEFAPVGIFRTDANGVTNYVNPRYCEISKMNSEDALFSGWLNAVHPEDRLLLEKEWQKAALSGSQSYSEYRFLHADGSVTWVNGHAVPLKDQSGTVTGYIGAIEDITNRKRAEEKLIESEAYYRTLIDISPDGIITSDIEGNVTYASKKAFEIFDEPPGVSFIGTSVLNWLDPDYHQPILERFSDIISGNLKPVTAEYKLLKHDRSDFWAELSSCPITDAKGNTSGLLIVCRDISGRKKAEEELIKARDKAEEGDKLKTAFLHNISHEIRTPMNAITGFSALLGEPDLTRETQKSYIDIITQSSDHLLDVLNDIIEVSNIEAGILKLKKNEVNLNSLMGKLFKQFKPAAIEKGIEFNYTTGLPNDQADIVTDYAKLIQILSNLLGNALKFTIHGEIEFGYNLKNENLEFFVSDTGISIPVDQQKKIFDRFYQVEYTATRQFEGTGLGLSISKEYVELMEGNIWLTSDPGHGSVFYFSIPYEEVVIQQHINYTAYESPAVVAQKTLLVAEDDNNNFDLIRELLSELNVRIVRAYNGIEAVEISKSGLKIDLILMDIKMPLMDGYTAITKILDHSPDMKIIAQTAYGDDEAKSLEAGCAGFISKPFVKKQFIKLVKEFL